MIYSFILFDTDSNYIEDLGIHSQYYDPRTSEGLEKTSEIAGKIRDYFISKNKKVEITFCGYDLNTPSMTFIIDGVKFIIRGSSDELL